MKNTILWILGMIAIVVILIQLAIIVNQHTEIILLKTKSTILETNVNSLEKDVQKLLISVPAEQPAPDKKPPPKGKTFLDGHWHGDYWHDTSSTNQKGNQKP